jgi:hypothetical protein
MKWNAHGDGLSFIRMGHGKSITPGRLMKKSETVQGVDFLSRNLAAKMQRPALSFDISYIYIDDELKK